MHLNIEPDACTNNKFMKNKEHPFEEFLKLFVPKVSEKGHQICEAVWLRETTSSSDAADLAATLGVEEWLLYSDSETYRQLLAWDHDESLNDPILKRQLNVLIRAFKYNQVSKSLIEEISKKEATLSQTYVNFRPNFEDRLVSENDILEIEHQQIERFNVKNEDLGPWAWSDPFSQNDPLDDGTLDELVKDIDIISTCDAFFKKIGFDLQPVFERSDLFERPEKNQHAFCINMDRMKDVRILANVKPYLNWLDGMLHELGHVIYELGFNEKLPWLLRTPPSGITTEAVALLFNRQAYRYNSLRQLINNSNKEPLMKKAEESFKRRQLILSRFVMVLTFFEKELYSNPKQDLNKLWWNLVNKYQKIEIPKDREGKNDWAAKYHISLAPVYSFSYLLGEMFASSLEETLIKETGTQNFESNRVGQWLQKKLFYQGNRMSWDELVYYVTGQRLNADAWVRQFCQKTI